MKGLVRVCEEKRASSYVLGYCILILKEPAQADKLSLKNKTRAHKKSHARVNTVVFQEFLKTIRNSVRLCCKQFCCAPSV